MIFWLWLSSNLYYNFSCKVNKDKNGLMKIKESSQVYVSALIKENLG